MTVSMVSRCYETETHPITFDEIWAAIRYGEHGLKEKITQIRNRYESEKDITGSVEKAKKAVADLKLELPGFLPSGTFSKRETGCLIEYSGILCADLDSLGDRLYPVRDMLRAMPFIRAIALSPSGDGLKVFFNVIKDPDRHVDSFRSIKENMLGLDVEVDEKCKDPTRICFFTYDPDLYLNNETGEILPPADPLPPPPRVDPTSADVNMTVREQIAFSLLGELKFDSGKGGYFVRCPGENFHTAKTADKHTILYLSGAPTLSCQHQSCAHSVEAFNQVLRSMIGKAEFVPPPPEAEPKPPPEEEDTSTVWKDALISATVTITALHGLTLRPRKPLLGKDPAWFCEGDLGIIFGPRGVAKTFFAAALSKTLSVGDSIGEWKAPVPVKVLYIDAEMPADMMRSRFEALDAVNDNIELLNHEILFDRANLTMNLTRPEFQKAVMEYCMERQHKVVLLDNLSTMGIGMKENDSNDWDMINPWLLDMRRRQISVVILHHAGRSGEMRGTSRREDNVFWIISLRDRRKEEETTKGAKFVSTFSKPSRNTPEVIPDYEWHFTPDDVSGLITIDWKKAHSLHSFLEVLRSGVVKPAEIARVMNLPDYTISRLAHKAQKLGYLERRARGEYELTTAGECALDEDSV